MFNLFKKQEPVPKPVEETIIPKPTGEYYLECTSSSSSYTIYLMKKTGKQHDTVIKSATAWNDKERDALMSNFKLNKDQYIREYDHKRSQNVRIPL